MMKKIVFLLGVILLLVFTIKTSGGCWKIEKPFGGHCFGDIEKECLVSVSQTLDCNTVQQE